MSVTGSLGSARVWVCLGWEVFEACLRCCGPFMGKKKKKKPTCDSSSFVLLHTNTSSYSLGCFIDSDALQLRSNFSSIQTQTPLPSSVVPVCEIFFFSTEKRMSWERMERERERTKDLG